MNKLTKTIYFIFGFLLMVSLVVAANYDWLYNPYTARQDRSLSLNQSGNNITVDSILFDENVSATYCTSNATCIICQGATSSLRIC